MNNRLIFGNNILGDSLMDVFEAFREFDRTPSNQRTYPPYNSYYDKTKQEIILELGLAGFTKNELSVEVDRRLKRLTISGEKTDDLSDEPDNRVFTHRSLAKRSFKIGYPISDELQVMDITFMDGILKIVMKEVLPEEMKPKLLEIK